MKQFDESLNWYKGNLHTHTTLSDGVHTPDEVIEIYRAKGYDFLALTDHRRLSMPETVRGMLMTGGVEFDYMLDDECIHIVGIGLRSAPELNPPMCGQCAQQAIDAINAHGGFAILAHPSWSMNTLAGTLPLRDLGAMEIFNSTSDAPWNPVRGDASQFVDLTYTRGKYTPLVASDDSHSYTGEHTRSFTWVNARELTLDSILEALRAGRMFASQGPRFTQIEYDGGVLSVDCEPVVRAVVYSNLPWASGRVVTGELTHFEYTPMRGERYLRVRIEDADGNLAWSQPVIIEPAAQER